MLHTVSDELRTSIQECESQIQSVKQANDSEFMRVNQVISSLETKIIAGVANSNRLVRNRQTQHINKIGYELQGVLCKVRQDDMFRST